MSDALPLRTQLLERWRATASLRKSLSMAEKIVLLALRAELEAAAMGSPRSYLTIADLLFFVPELFPDSKDADRGFYAHPSLFGPPVPSTNTILAKLTGSFRDHLILERCIQLEPNEERAAAGMRERRYRVILNGDTQAVLEAAGLPPNESRTLMNALCDLVGEQRPNGRRAIMRRKRGRQPSAQNNADQEQHSEIGSQTAEPMSRGNVADSGSEPQKPPAKAQQPFSRAECETLTSLQRHPVTRANTTSLRPSDKATLLLIAAPLTPNSDPVSRISALLDLIARAAERAGQAEEQTQANFWYQAGLRVMGAFPQEVKELHAKKVAA